MAVLQTAALGHLATSPCTVLERQPCNNTIKDTHSARFYARLKGLRASWGGIVSNTSKPNTPPFEPTQELRQNRPVVEASDIASIVQTVRTMVANGRKDDARQLLTRAIERAPEYEELWLQLLALEPSPREEMALLRSFLGHHPKHRYAKAFQSRLKDIEIVVMLEQGTTSTPAPPTPAPPEPPPLRLGDYLIAQGWVTLNQIEHAIHEQQELGNAGIEQRLGTILLRNGHLNQAQLGIALAKGRTVGLGQFGSYLVRHGILTPEQVGNALAYQAALVAEQERGYLTAIQRRVGKQSSPQPSRKPIPRLGEVMVQMGMLTTEQVEHALHDRETEFNTQFE